MLQSSRRGTNSAAAMSWLQWGKELPSPRLGTVVVIKKKGATSDSSTGSTRVKPHYKVPHRRPRARLRRGGAVDPMSDPPVITISRRVVSRRYATQTARPPRNVPHRQPPSSDERQSDGVPGQKGTAHTPPSRRELFEPLSDAELAEGLTYLGFSNESGSMKVVDLLSHEPATDRYVLQFLSRGRLRALCRHFGIDDSGSNPAAHPALVGARPRR
jgi:hypothetical protein